MTDCIRIALPWPPSNNVYYRHVGGTALLSKPGRMYAMTVGLRVAEAGIVREHGMQLGRLHVRITAFPPDRVRRDLDNLLKATLDSLTKARVWIDDSQIDRLEVVRRSVIARGELVVEIMPMVAAGVA